MTGCWMCRHTTNWQGVVVAASTVHVCGWTAVCFGVPLSMAQHSWGYILQAASCHV